MSSKYIFMKTFILVCLVILSVQGSGQDRKSNFIPQMFHGIGGSFQEFDGLNSRIANFPQYKALRDHMGTLQLGWFKERNRLISGLAFTAGSSMSGDRDKKSSTLRFIGFSADIGYNILNSERMMLYPLAGLGYERYQARFFKDNSNVDFNTILQSAEIQNRLEPVDFKNSFLTYRLGAGFSIKAPKNPSHSIGLQAGYIGSFKDHAWRSNENQELMNAPEDGVGRIFVTLTFMSQPRFMKH